MPVWCNQRISFIEPIGGFIVIDCSYSPQVHTMSSSNQNGQTAPAATATQVDGQSLTFTNDLAKLETLIPKNLSTNKRAVIERLVTLYEQNSSDR